MLTDAAGGTTVIAIMLKFRSTTVYYFKFNIKNKWSKNFGNIHEVDTYSLMGIMPTSETI